MRKLTVQDCVERAKKEAAETKHRFIEEFPGRYSFSEATNQFKRRLKLFLDILENNEDGFFEKYDRYCELGGISSYEAKLIRYGPAAAQRYREKLVQRPKVDRSNQNNYDPKFLSSVHNISIDAAVKLAKERRERAGLRSLKMHADRKASGYNYRIGSPMCIEYYLHRGASAAEAEEKLRRHIEFTRTDVRGFALRHPEEDATALFKRWAETRSNNNRRKYGTAFPCGARTSKESLRFFTPLYKELRKMGIEKLDIYWGISGSKEFFLKDTDGATYAFDFTIKSLKYVVEYNGSFWHSRPDEKYRGFLNETDIIAKDLKKSKLLSAQGYSLIVVWDTDDHDKMRSEILREVEALL